MQFNSYNSIEKIEKLKDCDPLSCVNEMIKIHCKKGGFEKRLEEIFIALFSSGKIKWSDLVEFNYSDDLHNKKIGLNYFFLSLPNWVTPCFLSSLKNLKEDKKLFLSVAKSAFLADSLSSEDAKTVFLMCQDEDKDELMGSISSFDKMSFLESCNIDLWKMITRGKNTFPLPCFILLNSKRVKNFHKDKKNSDLYLNFKNALRGAEIENFKSVDFNTQIALASFSVFNEDMSLEICKEFGIKKINFDYKVSMGGNLVSVVDFFCINGLLKSFVYFDKKEKVQISLPALVRQVPTNNNKKINQIKRFSKYWLKEFSRNEVLMEDLLASVLSHKKTTYGVQKVDFFLPIGEELLRVKKYDDFKNEKNFFDRASNSLTNSFSSGHVMAVSLYNFLELIKNKEFNWCKEINGKSLFFEFMTLLWYSNSTSVRTKFNNEKYLVDCFNGFSEIEKGKFWRDVFNSWECCVINSPTIMSNIESLNSAGFYTTPFVMLSKLLKSSVDSNLILSADVFEGGFDKMIDNLGLFSIFEEEVKMLSVLKLKSIIGNKEIIKGKVVKI